MTSQNMTPAAQQTTNKTTWAIDPAHTTVGFAVKHMMFATVRGFFKNARGTIVRDERDITKSTVEAEVDVATVDTGAPDRDAHLRSADFFDAENHPTLKIKSKRIEPLGGNRYRLLADFTIRGVTREVPFTVEFEGEGKDPFGNWKAGATIEGVINRKDYGLNWNAALEAGGFLVGDEVRITIHAQAARQA